MKLLFSDRKSRRVPAARRYKIIKKIATSKRKKEKEAKKLPKRSAKQKLIQIPNICPFKEDILKDVEADKARREEEKKQKLEQMKQERIEAKKKQTMEEVAAAAARAAESHVEKGENDEVSMANTATTRALLQCDCLILGLPRNLKDQGELAQILLQGIQEGCRCR